MKKIIWFALILLFLIVGCTKENPVSENYVRVMPSKLFEGNAKKLEPHLDMITGCISVKYQGNKESLCLKYEIWENGKLKESQNTVATSIRNNEFNGEVSISLKDIIGTDLEKPASMIMKTIISDGNGYAGSTKYVERFKEHGYGPVEIPGELNVIDSEELSVWGLTSNKGSYTSGGKVEEEVQTADWGLILKLYFK